MTLNVLNLNHDNKCPFCGQIAANSKDFVGEMDLGMVEDWEIKLHIQEHLYDCENPLCQRNQFFSRNTDSFYRAGGKFYTYKKYSWNERKIVHDV